MKLTQGLANLELNTVDDTQIAQLEGYTALVQKWNKTINLISRRDIGRFVTRHLLDSLSITPWVTGARCADIGTGAGLPGLPLAIVSPQREFVLVDRSERKVRFLKQVIRSLELTNVRALAVDAKDLARQPAEQQTFDCIVSRAVAPPQNLWAMVADLLAPSGRLVLQVAVGERQEDDPALSLNEETTNEQPVAVPGLSDNPDLSIEHHETLVPGLQLPHQVLVITKRITP